MVRDGENAHEGSKAFQRHVKQQIQARVHRFLAITPPELSSLCRDEMAALGLGELESTEAGIEFSGELPQCYLSNLWLRTASRVLCRLPEFRAGAAEELFRRVLRIPWELWLNSGLPLHITAFVEHSRLEHEGAVVDTVLAGVRKRFSLQNMEPPVPWNPEGSGVEAFASLDPDKQRILVHVENNRCRISLDSTGAHLHQRGYRRRHMGAPLRETLAAAILLRAGWQGEIPLVDGMCGSGTLPIEAALLARRLPPGGARPFLFERWPSFQAKTWNYLRHKAMENALPRTTVPIIGMDRDAEAVAVSRENGVQAGVGSDIEWLHEDFLKFNPAKLGLKPGLLVLNPPYGRRLAGGGKELFHPLANHLRSAFAGWKVAILVPDRSLSVILGLPSMRFWTIRHGGLPIMVALARL